MRVRSQDLKLEPQVKIQIGDRLDALYIPAFTHAPRAYDGFGTIEVDKIQSGDKEERLVFIRKEHFEWQTLRYRSGAYSVWQDEMFPIEWVTDRLVKRFLNEQD